MIDSFGHSTWKDFINRSLDRSGSVVNKKITFLKKPSWGGGHVHPGIEKLCQTDKWTNGQPHRQTNRHTDRQDIHSYNTFKDTLYS